LQGGLASGTAPVDSIGRPSASKTGTADSYVSAFFVGYTPQLLGAVWVGNPRGNIDMVGTNSCYRLGCVGSMYGSMAPGHTWQNTFLAALRGMPAPGFVAPSPSSPLFALGPGFVPAHPPKPHHHGAGGRPGPGGRHHHPGPTRRGGGRQRADGRAPPANAPGQPPAARDATPRPPGT